MQQIFSSIEGTNEEVLKELNLLKTNNQYPNILAVSIKTDNTVYIVLTMYAKPFVKPVKK